MIVHFRLLGFKHDVKPSYVWSFWFNFFLSWKFIDFFSSPCFVFVAGFSVVIHDLNSNWELWSGFQIFIFVLVALKIKVGYESWFEIRLKIPSGFLIPVFPLVGLKIKAVNWMLLSYSRVVYINCCEKEC